MSYLVYAEITIRLRWKSHIGPDGKNRQQCEQNRGNGPDTFIVEWHGDDRWILEDGFDLVQIVENGKPITALFNTDGRWAGVMINIPEEFETGLIPMESVAQNLHTIGHISRVVG